MIKDPKLFDKLYDAAETVYKYMTPGYGFYAGTVRNERTGEKTHKYNIMNGSKQQIEKKLGRKLNKYEESILAIAICDLANKTLNQVLSSQEVMEIHQDLWNGEFNREHDCLTFDRLVTVM